MANNNLNQQFTDYEKKVPTLAEGGINLANYQAFKGTGVNIIVVGTSFDQLAANAVSDAVKQYLSLGE